MAADESEGRVAVRALLPEDGAGECRVVAVLHAHVDLNLPQIHQQIHYYNFHSYADHNSKHICICFVCVFFYSIA